METNADAWTSTLDDDVADVVAAIMALPLTAESKVNPFADCSTHPAGCLATCDGPVRVGYRILLLTRYRDLRMPSEVLLLRWEDIDWHQNRMLVISPKTEHHDGGESRLVPIFPELRDALNECWEQAGEGEEFVITKRRPKSLRTKAGNWRGANFGTMFTKLIRRAGLTPWPRLFQNIRSTRATELAEDFPSHVVNSWLGHTEEVPNAHDRQVTDDHFDRATCSALPLTLPPDAVSGRTNSQPENWSSSQVVSAQKKRLHAKTCSRSKMEAAGIETDSPNAAPATGLGNPSSVDGPRAATGDAISGELAWLVDAWDSLSDDIRSDVLKLVAGAVSVAAR